MNGMLSPTHKKVATWLKIGGVALAAFVISPIIFSVVQGIVGFVIAAAIGIAAVNLAPWFSIKMSTLLLKLIRADAASNPVETRLHIEQTTEEALTKQLSEIESFNAEVLQFSDQVDELAAKYPTKAEGYRTQLAGMQHLLTVRRTKWIEAKNLLARYKEETIEIEALWKMAQSAIRMNKLAGKSQGEDPMDQLRTRVANDSVHSSMNLAMSQLQTALTMESAAPKLSNAPAPALAAPNTNTDWLNVIDVKVKDVTSARR